MVYIWGGDVVGITSYLVVHLLGGYGGGSISLYSMMNNLLLFKVNHLNLRLGIRYYCVDKTNDVTVGVPIIVDIDDLLDDSNKIPKPVGVGKATRLVVKKHTIYFYLNNEVKDKDNVYTSFKASVHLPLIQKAYVDLLASLEPNYHHSFKLYLVYQLNNKTALPIVAKDSLIMFADKITLLCEQDLPLLSRFAFREKAGLSSLLNLIQNRCSDMLSYRYRFSDHDFDLDYSNRAKIISLMERIHVKNYSNLKVDFTVSEKRLNKIELKPNDLVINCLPLVFGNLIAEAKVNSVKKAKKSKKVDPNNNNTTSQS